jgi:hemolysin activation/secretion protein
MTRTHLLYAVCWLVATPAFAAPVLPPATEPGAIQQRQIDEEHRRREDEREQRKTDVEPLKRPVEAAPAVQAGQEAVRFFVRQIVFSKSEILSEEELNSLAKDYLNRESSLAELQALAVRINELYRSKGVVTAQAVIPPQDVTTGIIHIRLVEGRLGKVSIKGNESTKSYYIDSRLHLAPGDLIDLAKYEAALVRFNRTNDVQLQAQLAPGEKFATTDLALTAAEPERQEFRLTLDNLGSTATGKERAGLAYENRSVLGYRDDLGLSYSRAVGQESQSASYAFPVNTWGGRLNLGYYKDSIALKRGPLASLNITGDSTTKVASLRQPAYIDSTRQLDIVAGWKQQRSSNWIDGMFLSQVNVSATNLGVEARRFGRQSTWSGSYVRSFGSSNATEPSGFIVDRGSLRHSRDLGHDLALVASLSWQSTRHDFLPSSEQMFIGGEGSVRGYPVGVYSGDTGQIVNLELHHPLLAASEATHGISARGFFFADYGRVKPYRPPGSGLSEYDQLTGVGWGVQSNLGKHVYARLTLGYGLDNVPLQPQHYEITLQLMASAF